MALQKTGTGSEASEASEASEVELAYRSIKAMIVDGTLKSGAAVSQLQLSRALGMSRTPIREALRRLQAEGLLDGKRNHRMRVTAISPDELDATYATRIFLEAMGVALTVPHLSEDDLVQLKAASKEVDWDCALTNPQLHDRQLSKFKLLAMKYSGEGVVSAVAEQFNRCERVRKIYQTVSPANVAIGRDEHFSLLDAYQRRSVEDAVFVASRHLGRTALAVIGYMAPDYEPRAVRFALAQTARGTISAISSPVLNIVGNGPVRPPGQTAVRKR
jgi:DNA-binding GntR family transcriptional regulator